MSFKMSNFALIIYFRCYFDERNYKDSIIA